MAKYNIIPNSNYNTNPLLKTFDFNRVEKIIWYKKVGDLLNAGDVLCEIHYNDCILEMECFGGDYLLYQNTKSEISFNNILAIYGDKGEDIKAISNKHQDELKHYDSSDSPIFNKIFQIENSYNDCKKLID